MHARPLFNTLWLYLSQHLRVRYDLCRQTQNVYQFENTSSNTKLGLSESLFTAFSLPCSLVLQHLLCNPLYYRRDQSRENHQECLCKRSLYFLAVLAAHHRIKSDVQTRDQGDIWPSRCAGPSRKSHNVEVDAPPATTRITPIASSGHDRRKAREQVE